jgi:hypothetical protein
LHYATGDSRVTAACDHPPSTGTNAASSVRQVQRRTARLQHFRGSIDIWDPALVDGPSGGQLQLSNIEVQKLFLNMTDAHTDKVRFLRQDVSWTGCVAGTGTKLRSSQ